MLTSKSTFFHEINAGFQNDGAAEK